MPTRTRKDRGARTQDIIAAYYRSRGWPDCYDVAAAVGGADLLGMLGLAPEVKARRGFSPLAWLKQARRNAKPGEIPYVVFRCDGQGPATVGEWGVLMTVDDHIALLHEANYGVRTLSEVRDARVVLDEALAQVRDDYGRGPIYDADGHPVCTCTRVNTVFVHNPQGHDAMCGRWGTDLPQTLPEAAS